MNSGALDLMLVREAQSSGTSAHQADRLSLQPKSPDSDNEVCDSIDDLGPSSQSSEYIYEPLENDDTIRILVLYSANDNTLPIETEIIHRARKYMIGDHFLPVFQDYIAISYHWGPANFSHSILCSGKRLAVTPTVDNMLRQLRKNDKQRNLWIDAICLNQADAAEKAVQIRLMRQIYQESQKVIVSLSVPATIPESLRGCYAVPNFYLHTSRVGSDAVLALKYLKLTGAIPQPRLQLALELLMLNPWFKRRWVIQEATAHAHTTIHYEGQKIAWVELASSLDALEASQITLSDMTTAAIERFRSMQKPPRNIFRLLRKFHVFDCGDERDRIAALRGLALYRPGDHLESWTVSYEQHWTANYRSLARTAIFTGHSAEVFHHLLTFGSLACSGFDVPEWVPDWSSDVLKNDRSSLPSAEMIFLGASFDVRDIVRQNLDGLFEDNPRRLALRDRFSLAELEKHMDQNLRYWEVRKVYDRVDGDHSVWSPIVYLLKMLADVSDMTPQVLVRYLTGLLRIDILSSKYLHQSIGKAVQLSRFRKVLEHLFTFRKDAYWLRPSGVQLILSAGSGPGGTYAKSDNHPHTHPVLDLLDLGIINDVLCAAIDELLQTHVFFDMVNSMGHRRLGIATRGLKRGWLIMKDEISSTTYRIFEQLEASSLMKKYGQTELIALVLGPLADPSVRASNKYE